MLRTGPQEALEAGAGVTSFCARLHAPTQPQRLALSPHSWAVWRHKLCPGASEMSPGGQEGLGGSSVQGKWR